MVMAPPPDLPPPPTIAYLRDVNGVQAELVSCAKCASARSIPWADLGLPDDAPFTAVAKSRAWRCQRCGRTDINAMPDWRTVVPVTKDEKVIDLQVIYRAKR